VRHAKYVVEVKRMLLGWSRGAVWAVRPDDFRDFLTYINGCNEAAGSTTRVRRIHGDPPAKYTWPKDRRND